MSDPRKNPNPQNPGVSPDSEPNQQPLNPDVHPDDTLQNPSRPGNPEVEP